VILPLLSVALTFFMLGRWSVQRSTNYRMGLKVLSDIEEIVDKRKFAGANMTVTVKSTWKARGHNWELAITEKEKELSQ
jgi:hypothetical protein